MSRSTRRSIRRSRRSKRGGASRSNRASNGNRRAKSIRGKSMRGGELLVATDFAGPFSYTRKKNQVDIYKLSYTPPSNGIITFDFRIMGIASAKADEIKTESKNRFVAMAGLSPQDDMNITTFIQGHNINTLVVTITPNETGVVTMKLTSGTETIDVNGSNTFDQVKAWLVDPTNAVDVAKSSIMSRASNMFSFGTKPAAAATPV